MTMNNAPTGAPRTRGAFLNLVLTANAVLLGLLLVGQVAPAGRALPGGTALAGPPEDTELNSRVSAAEQRKDIIAELRSLNQRLTSLDARFKGAVPVKVVEMPRENSKPAPVPPAPASK